MRLNNQVWANGVWDLSVWADGVWLEAGASPTQRFQPGGQLLADDDEHRRVRDAWERVETIKTADRVARSEPEHRSTAPRPIVARVPVSAPAARTTIHDGDALSEDDMLALVLALHELDD